MPASSSPVATSRQTTSPPCNTRTLRKRTPTGSFNCWRIRARAVCRRSAAGGAGGCPGSAASDERLSTPVRAAPGVSTVCTAGIVRSDRPVQSSAMSTTPAAAIASGGIARFRRHLGRAARLRCRMVCLEERARGGRGPASQEPDPVVSIGEPRPERVFEMSAAPGQRLPDRSASQDWRREWDRVNSHPTH